MCAQRSLRSAWASAQSDAQADLSLRWAQCHFVGFVMILLSHLRVYNRNKHKHMSRLMTKPIIWLCAQRRLRSAWESAQSDPSLRCPHEESLGP